MKFYKYNIRFNLIKIEINNITCIYNNFPATTFYKNGKEHNNKNASFIDDSHKEFYLNGKYYGGRMNFTKQSWRKFIKLQAFL